MIHGSCIRPRLHLVELMVELNENTKVPMRVLVGALGICAAAVWFTATVKNDIGNMQREMVALTTAIQALQPGDRWTGTDQRAWVQRLRDENPTLKVPIAERVK